MTEQAEIELRARRVAFLEEDEGALRANPIHSDAGARQMGFRAALVPGVTLWGWCVPLVERALGAQWLDAGWAKVRFRRPVYPGEELELVVRRRPSGQASFEGSAAGTVRLTGEAGFGEGLPPEYRPPSLRIPQRRPDERPELRSGTAPVGADLPAMLAPLSVDEARAYALEVLGEEDERWVGPRPRAHPAWLAGRVAPLLRHAFRFGPSIHVASVLQFIRPAHAGQAFVVAGRIADAYERNGHEYVVVDACVIGEDGRDVLQVRHTTIVRPAERHA